MVTTDMASTSRNFSLPAGHRWTLAPLLFLIAAAAVKTEETGSIENVIPSCEVDNVLKQYVPSSEYYTIQAQALRQELYRKLRQKMEEDLLGNIGGEQSGGKRTLASLARTGSLPYLSKRNVAALARAGLLKTSQEGENSEEQTNVEDADDDSDEFKRSLSALAKSGQLPSYSRSDILDGEGKRGIESLARNGELPHKRELEDLLNELYDKRHVGSLAKNFNYPGSGKRFLGSLVRNSDMPVEWNQKRNLGSVMRSGKRNVGSFMRGNSAGLSYGKRYPFDFKRNLGSVMRQGKRNVAALLRMDRFMSHPNTDESGKNYEIEEAHPTKSDENVAIREGDDKRNLASLKAHQKFKRAAQVQDKKGLNVRKKREASGPYYESSDELPVPVYQNQNSMDYEDLVRLFAAPEEKRFLGSVARSGWFRSPGGSSSQYRTPDKRHIGSLARLGWLPSFRSARSRFSRSGRSTPCDDDPLRPPGVGPLVSYREDSTNGETENYPFSEDQVLSGNRNYLLQSPLDALLLRKAQLHNL